MSTVDKLKVLDNAEFWVKIVLPALVNVIWFVVVSVWVLLFLEVVEELSGEGSKLSLAAVFSIIRRQEALELEKSIVVGVSNRTLLLACCLCPSSLYVGGPIVSQDLSWLFEGVDSLYHANLEGSAALNCFFSLDDLKVVDEAALGKSDEDCKSQSNHL